MTKREVFMGSLPRHFFFLFIITAFCTEQLQYQAIPVGERCTLIGYVVRKEKTYYVAPASEGRPRTPTPERGVRHTYRMALAAHGHGELRAAWSIKSKENS